MKRFLLQFFIVGTTATGVTANSAVLGFGIDTCKKVIENVEKNDDLSSVFKSAYTSYVLGFFSGVNVVYEDDTGLNKYDQLYQQVLSNCKETPDASFVSAIIRLYADFNK